ncbi:SusC/RagA family TonB-linked outer membrane protein [Draconibacterium sp.]|uniref:SusC/RagA family TonB-linked outer membrane protein n=1 Tax=Draconibacterium sp. TaxID=1965318 RepID=UPI0035666BC1
MKFTLLLFLLTTVQSFGTVYSQGTKFSIHLQNVNTVEIFETIEDQSEFKFLYNNDLLVNKNYDNLQITDKTVEQILDVVLNGTGNRYSVLENNLIVISPSVGAAQQGLIKGKVTDIKGEPLIGATIVVKGTTIGDITDINGEYVITNVPVGDQTLIVSFIGYSSQEIEVSGDGTYDITLKEDVVGLDEVVVVGYGTVKKSDLTGALSQVKGEDLAAYPALGMTQAMQGRAAGVQIQKNNGEPGASFNVRIRGSGSINSSADPLYVVDGFPGATAPPAEDIASIEILKDASATAIYGSRGANGVIMITTRRGAEGKARIEFNTSFSAEKEINRLDLLNKDQFTDYVTEVNPDALAGSIIGPGTDWQDEIFRTGMIQNHQLSITGGDKGLKYYVSGTLYDHEGIILNSGFKRYSITSNLDIKAGEKLNLGVNLFARRTEKDGVRTQEGSGGTNGTGVVAAAFSGEPTLPVYNEDGSYTISWLGDPNDNPVAIAKERSNNTVEDRFQANMFGEYQILPDLKFRVTIGANINNYRTGDYVPTTLNAGAQSGGSASINSGKYTGLINENYLTYTKQFGNHNISAMAGYSYESTRSEGWSASSQTFLTDASLWWNLDGASTYNSPGSGLVETELSSYYGRVNYKLFDRYMITLNARYDGSSRFAKNEKWAFFPSGAIAWNVMEESFMQEVKKISQLKLRASYGVTGNQSISPYQSLARLGTVHSIQNSAIVNAVRPTSVANDNLTWESTAQTDVGFDLGLFDQRLSLVGDYYYKKTTDLLFSMPLPPYSGYSSMLKNIGSLENKGVELTLSSINLNGELRWVTDLNFSKNRNKILELPDSKDVMYKVLPGHMVGVSTTNILREGEPVGVFYGYVYDGVYQEGETILPGNFDQYAGGEKYRDIDGIKDEEGILTGETDGKINGDDRKIIGNPHPDFIWGLNNTLEYKGFDLNIFIQGSQGNDIYSYTLQELETMRGSSNSTTEALRRWTPTNTDTDVPVANTARGYHSSSRWIFDGSYVRVKNLSLGYNLPNNLVQKAGLSNVRVYISGQNLWTITGYRGYDPEVNYGGSGSNTRLGFDYGSYPNAKSYTVGLKVTF